LGVALKILARWAMKKLAGEALSPFDHPNIATVFDFDRRRYRLSRHGAG